MPRTKIVPKESKRIKYFYVILVKYKGERFVKLGISSHVIKRVCCQYRNENTNGYLLDIYKVYKFKYDNAKYVELIIKLIMSKKYKAIKQEYFREEYKDMIINEVKRVSEFMKYEYEELNINDLIDIFNRLTNKKLKDK